MSVELAAIQQVKNATNRVCSSLPFTVSGNTIVIGSVTTASGALTANTLKTMLSITGSGKCNLIAVTTADTTSRTVRLQITLDGVVIFNQTTGAITTASNPITFNNNTSLDFLSSLKVEIASSLSETDKLSTSINYILT